MKLYNTLTRRLEDFTPLNGKSVKLYTCGPTVYNYYHIGNLRNAVFNDTLRRTLANSGYDVHHVMNITDVGHLVSDADDGEDKLEKGAKREGKSVWDVAAHYTQAFKADMAAMNIQVPNAYHSQKYDDNYARATEFIGQQIEMVKLLLEKGHAYRAEQAIYFDVSTLPDYGILTGQRLQDKETAARSEVISDDEKRNPYDFAVWFFTVGRYAGHTMHWPSPWGDGFPGWHLECSAIIHATLGDPIDIHTGGIDHIGTHHPNEMAQTEAAFGHPLAHTWMHNDFVLVDGGKMSKSLGNSYTLKDLTDKGFEPLAYRLLCLQAHYRSELSFSWDNLTAAQNRLMELRAWADVRWQPKTTHNRSQTLDELWLVARDKIRHVLENDLNTPQALAELGDLVNYVINNTLTAEETLDFEKLLSYVDDVFGLELSNRPDINDEQKQLIAERDKARHNKDWGRSDMLRDALKGQAIGLRDTPYGAYWYRLQ